MLIQKFEKLPQGEFVDSNPACANLDPDLDKVKQLFEGLLHEKSKTISELIDLKAELEQEKLRNAKILQEKDQALTAAFSKFWARNGNDWS